MYVHILGLQDMNLQRSFKIYESFNSRTLKKMTAHKISLRITMTTEVSL